MRDFTNERGLTLRMAMLIAAVVATVLVGGYALLTTRVAKGPSATPAPAQVSLSLPQLGVSLTLADTIKDLKYTYVGTEARLTSTSLAFALNGHTNSLACLSQPLGTLEKISGTTTQNTSVASAYVSNSGYLITKQFNGFYLKYTTMKGIGPQACTKEVADLQGKQLTGVVRAVAAAQAIK